ncbi:hypothetical protein EV122DRAFT_293159 [Schizophyllum commune]
MADEPGTAVWSEWQRRFQAAMKRSETGPLRPQFLRSPIMKEAHARMDSSKIPRRPFTASDAQVVDEAVQALVAYARLLERVSTIGGSLEKEAYAVFDHIWRWYMFLLPSSNNVADNGSPDNAATHFVEGRISTGRLPLLIMMRMLLNCVLGSKAGRAACLAQYDFVDAFIEVYTDPTCPRGIVPQVSFLAHLLIQKFARLLDDPEHSPRLMRDICEYDRRHPGRFLSALIEEHQGTFDIPFEEGLTPYVDVSRKLLGSDALVDNFVRTGGAKKIVGFLRRAAADLIDDTPSFAERLNTYWMSQFHLLAMTKHSEDMIMDGLEAGLLVYFCDVFVDAQSCLRHTEWRKPATSFIKMVLAAALVWPHILYAFDCAIEDDKIKYDIDEIEPNWEALSELYRLFEKRLAMLAELRAELKPLKWCHNAQCPGASEPVRKMCICGRVFYCSRTCQKVHWRAEHRRRCGSHTPDALANFALVNPELPISHLERRFFVKIARDLATQCNLLQSKGKFITTHVNGKPAYTDFGKHVVGYAIAIDCTHEFIPQLVAKFDDPLPAIDPPRVYVRVRLGPDRSNMAHAREFETPWQRRFQQALDKVGKNKLQQRFMRSQIIQARLAASNVPKLPLQASDVPVIDEAMQALTIYSSRLLSKASESGGDVEQDAYAIFGDIWKWISFLLPSSGNLGDTGNYENMRPSFVNGEAQIGQLALLGHLRPFFGSILTAGYQTGRAHCLAQRDFIDVFLSVYTAWYPRGLSQTTMFYTHLMFQGLHRAMEAADDSSRLVADIRSYDNLHPGKFLTHLVKNMALLFEMPFDVFHPSYFYVCKPLLELDPMVENFVRRDGVKRVIDLLRKASDKTIDETPPFAEQVNIFWISQLTLFIRTKYAQRVVTDSLEAGVLPYLIRVFIDPNNYLRGETWTKSATLFIENVLAPALVWPHVVHAFSRAIEEDNVKFDPELIKPDWEELSDLLYHYQVRVEMVRKLRATLKEYKRCHNTETCPNPIRRVRKMCICGRAFYCSEECQRYHWRTEHYAICRSRDARAHFKLENPGLNLQHFERCFLKMLVRSLTDKIGLHQSNGHTMITYVDGEPALVNYRKLYVGYALVVDFSQSLVPRLSHNFPDPLPPCDPPHVYARVRLGREIGVVLMVSHAVARGVSLDNVYGSFERIWQWLVFLLPSSCNVRDDGGDIDARACFVEGEVRSSRIPLLYIFRVILHDALKNPNARSCCLAQSSFINVFLEVYTAPRPRFVRSTTILPIMHAMVGGLNSALADQLHASRFLGDICEYNQSHPGALLCTLFSDLSLATFDARAEQSVSHPYVVLSESLLKVAILRRNFIEAGGGKNVTELLRKAVLLPVHTPVAISYASMTNLRWLNNLAAIAADDDTNQVLVDALRSGLLRYFFHAFNDRDGFSLGDWRDIADRFLDSIIAPRLVWPPVLCAFDCAIRRLAVRHGADALSRIWEVYGKLLREYEKRLEAMVKLRSSLKEIRFCHNGDHCLGSTERVCKMCRCGRVFYCSRDCQKSHWRREHRAHCSGPDTRAHLKLEDPGVPLTNLERCYLKAIVRSITEPTGLHKSRGRWMFQENPVGGLPSVIEYRALYAGFAILIDFVHPGEPQFFPNFEDPLSASTPPRAYARVQLGLACSIIFMGLLTPDPW